MSLVVQVCNLEVLSSSEEASIADNRALGEGERCAEIQEPSAHKDVLEEEMTGHRNSYLVRTTHRSLFPVLCETISIH